MSLLAMVVLLLSRGLAHVPYRLPLRTRPFTEWSSSTDGLCMDENTQPEIYSVYDRSSSKEDPFPFCPVSLCVACQPILGTKID